MSLLTCAVVDVTVVTDVTGAREAPVGVPAALTAVVALVQTLVAV